MKDAMKYPSASTPVQKIEDDIEPEHIDCFMV